jgi:hypothetical protein
MGKKNHNFSFTPSGIFSIFKVGSDISQWLLQTNTDKRSNDRLLWFDY